MSHKIIVTGGCGYIGSHTVVELIKHNFEVVILDDLSNSNAQIIAALEQITGVKPTFINVDLKDRIATQEAFETHSDAKAVIHFAAHKSVGESVENPLKYYQNNLYALLNTLEAQKLNGIHNFIFSSSATVYGTPEHLPVTEKDKTQRPLSAYGNTKKIGEEILEEYVASNADFSCIALRYFNPIGAHQSGLIGEIPNGIPNNLMPYITQTAVGLREKLMVFGDDYNTKDGTAIRDYIHVVDLAKAHVAAVRRLLNNEKEMPFEIFNLGTGTGYSVMDVVTTFEKVTQVKLNYEITTRRKGDVAEIYAATALAESKLKWSADKNLEDMIASSWLWEQHFRKAKK